MKKYSKDNKDDSFSFNTHISNKRGIKNNNEKNNYNEGVKAKTEYLKNSHKIVQYEEARDSNANSGSELSVKKTSSINENKEVKKSKFITITTATLLIIVVIGIIIIFIVKPWKKKNNNSNENNIDDGNDKNPDIQKKPKMRYLTIDQNSEENIMIEGVNITVISHKNNSYYVSFYNEYNSGNGKIFSYSILLLKSCLNNEVDNCLVSDGEISNLKTSENKPLCLFNISDGNDILSVKCPNYLNENQTLNIISDLNYLINFINTEETNNRNLETRSDTKSCGINCIENKTIITNTNSSYEETIIKNKTSSNKNGYNSTISNKIYKETLDKDSDLLGNFNSNKAEDIFNFQQNKIENDNDNFDNEDAVNLFNIYIKDLKFSLNNIIGNKDGTLKGNLNFKINNEEKNLNYFNLTLPLNEINNLVEKINKIHQSGKELRQEINLDEIVYEYYTFFNDVNNKIKSIDLNEIKEPLIIKEENLTNIKNNIESSKTKLQQIGSQLQSSIIQYSEEINNKTSEFSRQSIELKKNVSQYIGELSKLLNSQKNTHSKIAYYYSNNTSTSILDIIQKAVDLCEDNGKESINKEKENMFNKFKNKIDLNNYIKSLI